MLINLSDLITILYNNIGEINSAKVWLNNSSVKYTAFVDEYCIITKEEVQKVHPEFVFLKEDSIKVIEETEHITGSCFETTESYYYLEFTTEGSEFVKEIKKKWLESILKNWSKLG